jgi:hypothetical protein
MASDAFENAGHRERRDASMNDPEKDDRGRSTSAAPLATYSASLSGFTPALGRAKDWPRQNLVEQRISKNKLSGQAAGFSRLCGIDFASA